MQVKTKNKAYSDLLRQVVERKKKERRIKYKRKYFPRNIQHGGYCNEYRDILRRAATLGYAIPDAAQRSKQDKLLRALKTSGIWALLDILYIYAQNGGGDFATLNWKNAALYQCSKVNTPTFTNNEGFDFNGTTQYLNTNWIPSVNGVNYTRNNASAGCRVNDNVSVNGAQVYGCSNNADGISNGSILNPRNGTGSTTGRCNDNTTMSSATATSLGFFQVQRTGANFKAMFIDGASVATSVATASTALVTVSMFVGATNGNGAASGFSSREIAMFFAGASLAGLEATFYTLWNNYYTSL